jgi:hypothetical protein
MIWSISKYKEFQRCQRKWFLSEKLGARRNKDALRNEVYFLSELVSIDAWRGQIVDYTISEFVVPKLNRKQNIVNSEVLAFAKKLTRARYDFAKAQRYKEDDMVKTAHEYDYSALYEFEYTNSTVDVNAKFKKAWSEIEIALNNFLGNQELIEHLKTANYLAKQKNLMFKSHGHNIKGVPDLVAFFPNKPPHIVDWKVHYWGTKSYNEQLLVYAVALKSCNPHKDFPVNLSDYSIQDISLTEYQLLKNTVRNYNVSDDHIEIINDFIAGGLHVMERKGCHQKYEQLNIEDFELTQNLDNCKSCPFKRICKEN